MLEAIYREIVADPADDLARLAYADLLEEMGGDEDSWRAEFIRAQLVTRKPIVCNLAGGSLCKPRTPQEFILIDLAKHGCSSATFTRGFVSAVALPLDTWLTHGVALTAAHPLEHVELSNRGPAPSRHWNNKPCWCQSPPGYDASNNVPAECLPRILYSRLNGERRAFTESTTYDSNAIAIADLSRVLLEWGRDPIAALRDRCPAGPDNLHARWRWSNAASFKMDRPSFLTEYVWQRLKGGNRYGNSRIYRTREEALADLSQAIREVEG